MNFSLADFDYYLPAELIANQPVEPRDQSRLLIVDRATKQFKHKHFYDLADLLTSNDVLVLNETKVFPARLLGKKDSGGKVELLLLRQLSLDTWQAISKPGLKIGKKVFFGWHDELKAEVIDQDDQGHLNVKFNLAGNDFLTTLDELGKTPIPPYIKATQDESKLREVYQTIYAKNLGSAAAPTAGLHFTKTLLEKLIAKGVTIAKVTLHVGLGTFQPVKEEHLKAQKLHQEFYEIDEATARLLNQAKQAGKRIICVGTTSTRALESACKNGQIQAQKSDTQLFIYPGKKFNFVDSLITNFHLPGSSLLMLVAALVSKPNTTREFSSFKNCLIGQAYQQAIAKKYRFYSFGDAMWIV